MELKLIKYKWVTLKFSIIRLDRYNCWTEMMDFGTHGNSMIIKKWKSISEIIIFRRWKRKLYKQSMTNVENYMNQKRSLCYPKLLINHRIGFLGYLKELIKWLMVDWCHIFRVIRLMKQRKKQIIYEAYDFIFILSLK